jgi:hypothetical protein
MLVWMEHNHSVDVMMHTKHENVFTQRCCTQIFILVFFSGMGHELNVSCALDIIKFTREAVSSSWSKHSRISLVKVLPYITGQIAAVYHWSKCCRILLVKALPYITGQSAAVYHWSKCCPTYISADAEQTIQEDRPHQEIHGRGQRRGAHTHTLSFVCDRKRVYNHTILIMHETLLLHVKKSTASVCGILVR